MLPHEARPQRPVQIRLLDYRLEAILRIRTIGVLGRSRVGLSPMRCYLAGPSLLEMCDDCYLDAYKG